MISESLREISYLGNFEIKPSEYHIGLLAIDSYHEDESILKLDMLREVFLPMRKELLNIQTTVKETIDKPINQ